MFLLIRQDGASFASCSVEHAITLAGYLEGLDVAYRYRPKRINPKVPRTFICFHCGLCGLNPYPDHEACSVHGLDGITCPAYDMTATVAYVYGAAAARCFDDTADLDEIEELVERGGWAEPDRIVYEMIQRYRR